MLKIATAIIILICLPVEGDARSDWDKSAKENHVSSNSSVFSEPCFGAAAFQVGNACFTVANDGAIGNLSHYGIDLTSIECRPWVLHYPQNSNVEYLFGSSYWIGGVVGNDTLVSVGADGWQLIQEFFPDSCPDGDIVTNLPGAISEHDIISKFHDTMLTVLSPDHSPLGIEITQKSYVWSGHTGGEFYIFECVFENIGTNNITSGWVGIYCDADVGMYSTSSYLDDLSGYLPDEKIAYIIDNDGDPLLGAWKLDSSARGAVGYKLLGSQPPMDSIRFNWWVSHGDPNLDWGPRMEGTVEDPFRDFRTGGFGTPEGDANKYYMLSHDETDYDQIWANTDMSGDGWFPPHVSAGSNYVDGEDARFVYSFGPFDLSAGDSIRFFYTMAIGDSVHVDPDNFANNLPDNPQAYYDNLNFDNLVNLINAAEIKYAELVMGTGIEEITGILPTSFELSQNYPNPFNPSTTIEFSVPRTGHVELSVYNILGQRVRTLVDEDIRVGKYKVTWDGKSTFGKDVSSGVYLLQMQASESLETRKMLLLR